MVTQWVFSFFRVYALSIPAPYDFANEGMTMCCVSHEMDFARKVSDRVIFMDQSRIVEDCSTDDFFGKSEERSDRAKDFLSKILMN